MSKNVFMVLGTVERLFLFLGVFSEVKTAPLQLFLHLEIICFTSWLFLLYQKSLKTSVISFVSFSRACP